MLAHVATCFADVLLQVIIHPLDELVSDYYDEDKVRVFARVVSMVFGLVLLIAPIAILTLSEGRDAKSSLVIISSFMTLFWGILALFTAARTWEIAGITAVYV